MRDQLTAFFVTRRCFWTTHIFLPATTAVLILALLWHCTFVVHTKTIIYRMAQKS